MATVQELLSKNLARLLKTKNLTQVDFAKKMGVTFQTVNGVMTGSRSISLGMITRIAKALRIQESELLDSIDDEQIGQLIAELRSLSHGRRAFLIETWTSELQAIQSGKQQKPNLLHILDTERNKSVLPDDVFAGIRSLSQESRDKLIEGIRAWLTLPDSQKFQLTKASVDLARKPPNGGKVPKLKA